MKNRRESDLNFLDMVAHLVDQAIDGNGYVISIKTSSRTNLHKGGPMVHLTAEGFFHYFGADLCEYRKNADGTSIVRAIRGPVEYYALISVRGQVVAQMPKNMPQGD